MPLPGETASTNGSANDDHHTPPATKLIPAFGADPPVKLLRETLEYSTSPKDYLVQKRGADVFEKCSKLLSLPEESIDRDRYGTGMHKQHFEHHIAQLLSKEHGLFFVTGVQAQLTALKIYCDGAGHNRVAWHHRSHLEVAEQRAYAEVFRLERTFVGHSDLEVPTVADVKSITSLPAAERPAVILLELPNRELGCQTYSWNDLVQIADICKAAGVKLHMDGARIWEIEPYYKQHDDKSFADIASLFDSVYVSFYKGLRGVCGAMLVSSDELFMTTAKSWQRRLGGNQVTSYQEIIDCERGFNINIGTFHGKWQKMRSVVAAIKAATAEYRTQDGQSMIYFNPSVPTCCDIHTHIIGYTVDQLVNARTVVEKEHNISVFSQPRPWQNSKEKDDAKLVQRNEEAPDEGAPPEEANSKERTEKEHHYVEWYINDGNSSIEDATFAKGWKALCEALIHE